MSDRIVRIIIVIAFILMAIWALWYQPTHGEESQRSCIMTPQIAQQLYGGALQNWRQMPNRPDTVIYNSLNSLDITVGRDNLIFIPQREGFAWFYLDEFYGGFFALKCVVSPEGPHSQEPSQICPKTPKHALALYGGMDTGWFYAQPYPEAAAPLGYIGGSRLVFVVPRHGLAVITGESGERLVTPGYVANVRVFEKLTLYCYETGDPVI